eukprot:Gb_36953 [translate_table: standard]
MENQPQSSDNASSIPPEPQISQAPIPESLMNCGFPLCPNWGAIYPSFAPPVFPYMYPAWVLTFQPQDLHQQSGGIYAVPVLPYTAATSDFTPIGLIPLSYSIPSSGTASPVDANTQTAGPASQESPAAEGPRQQHVAAVGDAQGQRHEQPRQIFLRFIGFRLGLLLLLKLAMLATVFNQGGSKESLRLIVFLNLAHLVYLYRLGAFAPLLRWLSQSARRAMVPARDPARAFQVRQDVAPGMYVP